MSPLIYPSFLNENDQRQFELEGYVIVCLHDALLPDHLETFISSLNPDFGQSFYYSLMAFPPKKNMEISDHIQQLLLPETQKMFKDYTLRNLSFIAKPGRINDEMYLHQDWSFTDMDHFATGTLWIPLCDTHYENGALFVLPGSHRLFKNYISGSIPTMRIPSGSFSPSSYQILNVKRGQAVIFNPAVFHGSCPNQMDKVRIAVTASIFPKKAPFIYYKRTSSESITKVTISDHLFLEKLTELSTNDSSIPDGVDILYSEEESRAPLSRLYTHYT